MIIKFSTGESVWGMFMKISLNREMSYSFIYDDPTQRKELLLHTDGILSLACAGFSLRQDICFTQYLETNTWNTSHDCELD